MASVSMNVSAILALQDDTQGCDIGNRLMKEGCDGTVFLTLASHRVLDADSLTALSFKNLLDMGLTARDAMSVKRVFPDRSNN
jgi:hypothetical protein